MLFYYAGDLTRVFHKNKTPVNGVESYFCWLLHVYFDYFWREN